MDIAERARKHGQLARLAAAEIALAIKHRQAGRTSKADAALSRARLLMMEAVVLEVDGGLVPPQGNPKRNPKRTPGDAEPESLD